MATLALRPGLPRCPFTLPSRLSRAAVLLLLAAAAAPTARADDLTPKFPAAALRLEELPPLPEQRVGATSVMYGGKPMVIGGALRESIKGGLRADDVSATAWRSKRVTAKGETQTRRWVRITLEKPVAFAATVMHEGKLLVFGGIDREGKLLDTIVKVDPGSGEAATIGRLPKPWALGHAAIFKRHLFLVGGVHATEPIAWNRKVLWLPARVCDQGSTDSEPADPTAWEFAEGDGPTVVGAAFTTQYINMFLLGGWSPDDDGRLSPSAQVAALSPQAEAFWLTPRVDRVVWGQRSDAPDRLGLCGASPWGQAQLCVIGEPSRAAVKRLCEVYAGAVSQTSDIRAYHVGTDRWVQFVDLKPVKAAILGKVKRSDSQAKTGASMESPFVSPMLLPHSVGVDRYIVALDGSAPVDEDKSPAGVLAFDGELVKHPLKWFDYAVIALYFLAMLWIGWVCAHQEQTGSQYFLGSRKIPWWASAISVYATGTSAISFMSIPALTYMESLVYLVQPLITAFLIVAIVYPVIGLLRRLEVTTIYEYLEQRFNRTVQMIGSFLALSYQIGGRMALVILLPALGMSAVTPIRKDVSILLMGVITVVYTWSGGMKATIWTDLVQAILKLGGTIFCFCFILATAPEGIRGYLNIGNAVGKFNIFDFTFDLTMATFWLAVIRAVSDGICWLSDQANLQRVFSTENAKEARKTVLFSAFLTIPGAIVFYGIGTALFYFYHQQPEAMPPTLDNDMVYPFFISQNLFWGLGGLMIAALFAASMSTLSGVMNTVAAMVVRDLVRPVYPRITDAQQATLGKWVTLVVGIVATSIALWMAMSDIQSIFKFFLKMTGLIGGGMPAVILLGLFTKRTSAIGVLLGLAASLVATLWAWRATDLHDLLFTPFAITVCLVVGYAASFIFPNRKSADGLTIFTLRLAR